MPTGSELIIENRRIAGLAPFFGLDQKKKSAVQKGGAFF
jgi:hypothetical protein